MYEHILQNSSSLVFCVLLLLFLRSAHAMLSVSEMKRAREVMRVAAIDVSDGILAFDRAHFALIPGDTSEDFP